jgi:hypothetical protein
MRWPTGRWTSGGACPDCDTLIVLHDLLLEEATLA